MEQNLFIRIKYFYFLNLIDLVRIWKAANNFLKDIYTYRAILLNRQSFIYADFKCTCEQRNKGIVTLIPGRFH